ncbi:MAG: YbjN domain-containing protein [Alphaproteobacteria bacterium]
MVKRSLIEPTPQRDPILLWEDIALSHSWSYKKLSSTELLLLVETFPKPLEIVIRWDEASDHMEMLGLFDIRIPLKSKLPILEILSALSQEMRLGGFYLCPSERKPIFKYTLIAYPKRDIPLHHLSELTDEILFNGERLFQALQYILKEGRSVSEAIFAALVEIEGEA